MKAYILALLLAVAPFYAHAAEVPAIEDSVGALYKRDFNNSLHFSCTVSVVDHVGADTILLTANHCVNEAQKHYLVTFDSTQFYNAELYMIPRGEPDDPKDVDMALLRVKGDLGIPKLRMLTTPTKTGGEILMVGFPLGVAKLLYKGFLSGKVTTPGHVAEGSLILQTFGAPGSSGTSVIDVESGRIIGVFVAISSSFGAPVMYATPIEYIKYLVTPEAKRALKRKYYSNGS